MKKLNCLIVVFALLLAGMPGTPYASDEAQQEASLPLEELRLFAEVMERIKRDYVEEVDDKTLIRAAIRGMLAGLDPHSAWLDDGEWEDIRAATSGRYEGLGLEVTIVRGQLHVVAPIDGGPAARAGMKSGDVILRVDEEPVQAMGTEQAIRSLRGPSGTRVELLILREEEERPFLLELERESIRLDSVRGELHDDAYAYLRISLFRDDTPGELEQELGKLLARAENGMLHGLVLDLRSNPGGVMEAAIAVSDLFLDEGLVVSTEGRNPAARFQRNAAPGDLMNGKPIVVLIDGGSASASEIVAGALQDHGRAVVMGGKSFGKGSVQTVIPVPPSQGIKLTTAYYQTPAGRIIHEKGIEPDIESASGDALKDALNLLRGLRIVHARER